MLIKGDVTSFDPTAVRPSRWPGQYSGLFFQEALVTGVALLLDELHLNAAWSEFVGCTFRQKNAPISQGGPAAQGSFGLTPSLYRDCDFVGVRFRNLGRFNTGAARFENCRFTRSRFNGHFAYESDFVDCKFTGKIDRCVWGGSTPFAWPSKYQGRRNIITGNDFSDARLGDNIGWRFGFDFDAQHWPNGYVPTIEPQ